MDYNKMPTNSFDNFYLSWTPERPAKENNLIANE